MGDFNTFVRQLSEGQVEYVKNNLDKQFVNKITDKFLNTRPIHVACIKGHTDIVKLLIENKCDIELHDVDHWKPIHFACKYGYIEIVKLLIENCCNIECLDRCNKSPIDTARQHGHVNCAEIIEDALYSRKIFASLRENNVEKFSAMYSPKIYVIQENYTGLSVLEAAFHSKADKIIEFLMENPIDNAELDYLIPKVNQMEDTEATRFLKQSILYRCIKCHHAEGFHEFCCPYVLNNQNMIPSSFLEVAVKHGCTSFIKEILKKSVYDKTVWERAKLSAQLNCLDKIIKYISDRESVITSRLNRNFSLLHTAVCDNEADMVGYLLKNDFIDANINHEVFGTSLALAHSLHHENCIRILEQYDVNPNTQNKFYQTPLHEAIASGTHMYCEYLIDKSDEIDRVGFNNLTPLQCAVLNGCPDLCSRLMKQGADCSRYINFLNPPSLKKSVSCITPITSKENSLTLCLKVNEILYPCFLQALNISNSNSFDATENTLLHLAACCLQPKICESLLEAGAFLNKVNVHGNTSLLELLVLLQSTNWEKDIDKIIDTVKVLAKFPADLNSVSSTGLSVIQCASRYHSEKLMLALLESEPKMILISESDFQLIIEEKWFEFGTKVIKYLPKDCPMLIKQIIEACLKENKDDLVEHLFNSANKKLQEDIVEDLLYYAAENGNESLFSALLNTSISSVKLLENGENLFTHLLKQSKNDYCWKIMLSANHERYYHSKNVNNQSVLHVAIAMGVMNIVDNLIAECCDFGLEDNDGRTVLMLLFEKISVCNYADEEQRLMLAIKSMINKGVNIYMVTSRNYEVLKSCTRSNVKDNIEKFYKNQRERLESSTVEMSQEVDRLICKICQDNVINCSLGCGHTFCTVCSNKFLQCPFCQQKPVVVKRIYLP